MYNINDKQLKKLAKLAEFFLESDGWQFAARDMYKVLSEIEPKYVPNYLHAKDSVY